MPKWCVDPMALKQSQNEALLSRSRAIRTGRTEDQTKARAWLAHVQEMPQDGAGVP